VVGYALGLSGLFSLEWSWRERRQSPARAMTVVVAALLAAMYAFLFWGQWWWTISGLAAVAVSATSLIRRPEMAGLEMSRWWEPLLGHPERLLVGTFLTLSLAGAALLALPQSASSGRSIGVLDALFTSVSAVCVTGLVVLDTPVAFTAFGQLTIERRVLRPFMELLDVLQDVEEGVRLRRCRTPEAPREVVQVTQAVNQLLDERLARDVKAPGKQSGIEDVALTELLERQQRGAAIVDLDGHIVRANKNHVGAPCPGRHTGAASVDRGRGSAVHERGA